MGFLPASGPVSDRFAFRNSCEPGRLPNVMGLIRSPAQTDVRAETKVSRRRADKPCWTEPLTTRRRKRVIAETHI